MTSGAAPLLPDLRRFDITLHALAPLRLPEYKGSTLRGGFGHAFRKVVCTFRGKPCDDCLLAQQCVYSSVFETPPPAGSGKMTKYLRAPHPFVIEPPLEKQKDYPPGSTLTFGLVLVGRAIGQLPYFIYAFKELGTIGIGKGQAPFRLDRVCGDGVPVYEQGCDQLKPPPPPSSPREPHGMPAETARLRLRFLTPARIVANGRLTDAPDFQTIFRTLLRRLSLLSSFHCGRDMEADYRGLIERAGAVTTESSSLRWIDWERYSSRQDERMKLGGVMGEIAFSGNLAEFLPFLAAGELAHVGKGTSFGLGRYSLMPLGDDHWPHGINPSTP